MKLQIDVKTLVNLMKDLNKADGLPQDKLLRLAATENKLLLQTGNHELFVQKTAEDVEVELPGAVGVEFKLINDVLKKMKTGLLTIEAKENKNVSITNGQVSLSLQAHEWHSALPTVAKTYALTSKKDFFDTVNSVIHSVSKKDSLPILQSVLIKMTGHEMTLTATDSHRLSRNKLTVMSKDDMDRDLKPMGSMLKKASTLGFKSDDIMIQSDVAANYTILSDGETLAYILNAERDFPEVEKLISVPSATQIKLCSKELLDHIEMTELIAKGNKHMAIKLVLTNRGTILAANGDDNNSMIIDLDGTRVGEDVIIVFNPTYMKEALKTYAGSKITIGIASPIRPMSITDDSDNYQLITPIRTNGSY